MIRVDLLYFDGCPNVAATAERVRAVAAGLAIEIDLRLEPVASDAEAMRRRFPGSPSVRVNGVDIDPSAQTARDFGRVCRLYGGQGVPPEAMIAAALIRAAGRRDGPGSGVAGTGAVVAAALSSACCWLPLILIGTGLSAGGIAPAFAAFRPWLIGIAVVSLGFGVWLNERRPRRADVCCAPESHRRRTRNRVVLTLSALGVLVFALFPRYMDVVFGKRGSGGAVLKAREVTLRVDGMTCTGCESGIEAALRRLHGVVLADADYESGTVVVGLGPGVTLGTDVLIETIAVAGYTAGFAEAARESIDAPDASLRVLHDDLGPLAADFNAASNRHRFLAILSPT